jgi:hypothetical protein
VGLRARQIERVFADPPPVHPGASANVWRTHRECYELLGEHSPDGARTLETGLGVSTVLFALWRTEHVCVCPSEAEIRLLIDYLEEREIDFSSVDLRLDYSDDVLPTLGRELDLVFIDGGHGFPTPVIDWYFSSRCLRKGGIVVLDDITLPAVAQVVGFLELSPGWTNLARGAGKWSAYRYEGEDVRANWTHQPFLKPIGGRPRPPRTLRSILGRTRRKLMSRWSRLRSILLRARRRASRGGRAGASSRPRSEPGKDGRGGLSKSALRNHWGE